MTVPTVADVAAAIDVLGDIGEASDSFSIEQAMDMHRSIEVLQKTAKMTLSLVDTHLINTLESPQERHGILYAIKRKKDRKRFDHDRIASGVFKRAHYDENGERIRKGDDRLKRAVYLMRQLYLSPSVEAKVGVLDQLGFKRNDVETYELGDRYVYTEPVLQPPTEKANQ